MSPYAFGQHLRKRKPGQIAQEFYRQISRKCIGESKMSPYAFGQHLRKRKPGQIAQEFYRQISRKCVGESKMSSYAIGQRLRKRKTGRTPTGILPPEQQEMRWGIKEEFIRPTSGQQES
ncbi:hypothetical protein GMDG_00164 [Pseudogymnoascus destructans 20631-21]|uniref:Uncharacterized protein n=2 Tax=Pseudogymnoascus destructans TaxID=655981 RepID=L8FVA9_PSED2|nr:hypothetical protein GMDG_00164 [Pseudogymnoascus destructans 20631-21]